MRGSLAGKVRRRSQKKRRRWRGRGEGKGREMSIVRYNGEVLMRKREIISSIYIRGDLIQGIGYTGNRGAEKSR